MLAGGLHGYVSEVFPLLKTLITSQSKFIVHSTRERTGGVIIGGLLFNLIGLMSEIVIAKRKVKTKKKNNNNDNQDEHKEDEDDQNEDDQNEDDQNEDNQNEDDEIEDDEIEKAKEFKQKIREGLKKLSKNGGFGDYFGYASHLFDDKQWHFHLCHDHGAPTRDMLINDPWFTHDNGFAAMFDEKREEGSPAFQVWRYLRNTFRQRAPMHEVNRNQLRNDILKALLPSKNWKKSTYIEDVTWHMPDIYVDWTMVELSPRFYPTLRYIFTKMDNFKQVNNPGYNWRDYFQFYTNGSFHCKLDSYRDAVVSKFQFKRNKPIYVSTDGRFHARASQACDYETWEHSAKALFERSIKDTYQNDGLHFRSKLKRKQKKKQ